MTAAAAGAWPGRSGGCAKDRTLIRGLAPTDAAGVRRHGARAEVDAGGAWRYA
jgi:hypothetical protein